MEVSLGRLVPDTPALSGSSPIIVVYVRYFHFRHSMSLVIIAVYRPGDTHTVNAICALPAKTFSSPGAMSVDGKRAEAEVAEGLSESCGQ